MIHNTISEYVRTMFHESRDGELTAGHDDDRFDYPVAWDAETAETLAQQCGALVAHLTELAGMYDKLKTEINGLLSRYHDDGKNPNPIAESMSVMKTGLKLAFNESDSTIAGLMTDGCNMGVKSLNKYLNQYEAADEVSKDITKRLINLEEKLAVDIRQYL